MIFYIILVLIFFITFLFCSWALAGIYIFLSLFFVCFLVAFPILFIKKHKADIKLWLKDEKNTFIGKDRYYHLLTNIIILLLIVIPFLPSLIIIIDESLSYKEIFSPFWIASCLILAIKSSSIVFEREINFFQEKEKR